MREREKANFLKKKTLVRTTTLSMTLLIAVTLVLSSIGTAGVHQSSSTNENAKIVKNIISTSPSAGRVPEDIKGTTSQVQDAQKPLLPANFFGETAYACDIYPNFHSIYFDTDIPGTLTQIAGLTSYDFIAGGTWADGAWYGAEYSTSNSNFWTIDEITGAMTLIGATGAPGINGIAYDDNSATMYGCTGTDLYTIDMTTGAATLVGPLGSTGGLMIGLACDNAGNLYGEDLGDDSLYSIDPSTGAATLIGALGINLNYAQDCEWDKNNDILYLAALTIHAGNEGALYTCDPATGATTYVGMFASSLTEVAGMAIPYTAGPPPDIHDIQLLSVNDPDTGGAGEDLPVQVTIKNKGNYTETSVPVQVQIGQNAPPLTLLSEDFESGYPGWTIIDGGGGVGDSWTSLNPAGRSATGGCAGTFMIADSDWYGNGVHMIETLESPSFNCGAATQVLMDFGHYYWHLASAAYVDVWDGTTWTNVKTYTATTTGPEVGLDISSVAAGKTDVKIRFVYDDLNVWAWYWMVDNVLVYQPGGLVTEYDETEYVTSIAPGATADVDFDPWTPADWQVAGNTDISYQIVATQLLADDNPGNDQNSKSITLSYPHLHDIEVTSINSPPDRGVPAQTFPVGVTITNVGQFTECCYQTSAEIGKKVYTSAWQTIDWGGSSTWIQWPYGDHSYEPSDCGCLDYYAGCYYTQGGTFDTSLVTFALDLTTAGSSATVMLCEEFQDFAGYGQFGIYVHSGGVPDGRGTYSSYYEETLYYMTSDEIPRYGIYRIFNINPSAYADPANVYFEFWYTDDGYGNAWGCGIDCFEIPEIGFYEDFEGSVFPPADFTIVPEYTELVCTIDLDPGQSVDLSFPDWTPYDLQFGVSGSIEYAVQGTQLLPIDTNPGNDQLTESFTLDYWHDALVKEITQPSMPKTMAPWDFQGSFDLEAITGALGNAGSECDGTYMYSTRWASNLIHQIDFSGALIKEFSIPGVSGLRDLAYDGTYFYGGAAGGTIWEMDFDSEALISTISGGFQSRAITYNPDDDVFYCSNWGDPVWVVDRSGAIVDTINLGTTTSTYGFAYDNDGGNKYLYVFDQGSGGGTPQLIHQYDLIAGAFTGFTYDVTTDIPGTAGIAGGLFVEPGFAAGTISIGGLLQGTPDYMFFYELRSGGGGGGPVPITVWVPKGTHPMEAIVGNDGVFEETGLTCYAELYQFIDDPENGTLVADANISNIDLDPLGDEETVPFGTANFNLEGPWALFVDFPLYNDDKPNNNDKALGIGVDDSAPISSHSLDPATPDGEAGWYVSDVTVTLEAEDGTDGWDSGVDFISYKVDGGPTQTIPGSIGSFVITDDGENIEVEYWATDLVGNAESPHHTFDIDMDQSGASFEFVYEVTGGNPLQGWEFTFTATATDPMSGMNRVEFLLNDILEETVTGPGPVYQWIIMYYPFPKTYFKAIGYDNAGNSVFKVIEDPAPVNYVNSQQVTVKENIAPRVR